MYVAAILKNSGITQWVKRENSTGEDEGLAMAADVFGNVYLSGYYRNSISFAGGPALNTPTGNSEDIFVVSYSNAGNFLWAADAGDNGKDIPYGIACNLYKEAFVCGEYNKSADFGSTLLFNDGNSNAFIAKLGCPEILNNVISSSQVLCIGTAASDLSGSLPSGGTPVYTYKWEQSYDNLSWSAAAGVNDLQNYAPGVLSASTYFRRIVYSSSACYNADVSSTTAVNIDQLPSQSALAPNQTLCSSSAPVSLIAIAPVAGTGLWAKVSGGAVISDPAAPSTFASGLSAGSNIFTYTISNGVCPASVDSIVFNVDVLPDVSNAGINRDVCISDSAVSLNANAPAVGTGLWTLASGTVNIAAVKDPHTAVYNMAAGDNIFTWTISNGVCPSSSSNVTIHVDLAPDSAFAGNDISTDVPFVQLAANTPAVGYGRWLVISGAGDFSAEANASSAITGLETGQNILQWEISNGSCPSKKDEIIITLNPLHIPNAFSPNSDNKNDVFEVPGLEYYPSVNFKVFNKWGSIVYSNDNYKNEWTGRNRENEALIDDTYYYILEVSPEMKYSGFVLIKSK
jgi:gliding motility-associated-like protein